MRLLLCVHAVALTVAAGMDSEGARVPGLSAAHVGALTRHLAPTAQDKMLQFITGTLELVSHHAAQRVRLPSSVPLQRSRDVQSLVYESGAVEALLRLAEHPDKNVRINVLGALTQLTQHGARSPPLALALSH